MLAVCEGYSVSGSSRECEAAKRAHTRGAPTGNGGKVGAGRCGAYEGTHKGCPYGAWRENSEPLIKSHIVQGKVRDMTKTSLISEEQWSQIRRKAGLAQFAAAVGLLRGEVEDFFARPVDVQELPGGYYHDYFCPQHAVQLIFEPDSPTVHRCPIDGATFSGEPFDSRGAGR